MKAKCAIGISLFFILWIIFFPLTFLGTFQYQLTKFIFSDSTLWLATHFDYHNLNIDFSSDSLSLYILGFFLIWIASIVSIFVPKHLEGIVYHYTKHFISLYISLVLIKYGLDKIFTQQFYTPETNILYSRFGNLDRDILFWSVMGIAKEYSIFLGITEVLVAVCIWFKRTRTFGLCFATILFGGILSINIGFDISVKLFSFILLLMSVWALRKEWGLLYQLFFKQKTIRLAPHHSLNIPKWIEKSLLIVYTLLIVICIYPYFNIKSYDNFSTKAAFKVEDKSSNIRYIFFHSQQYIILMDNQENLYDYHYHTISPKGDLLLESLAEPPQRTKISYNAKDSVLYFYFKNQTIKAYEIDWKNNKALKSSFHWRVD